MTLTQIKPIRRRIKRGWVEIEMLKDISFDLLQLKELRKMYLSPRLSNHSRMKLLINEVVINTKKHLENNIGLYIKRYKRPPDMSFLRRYIKEGVKK